MNTGKLKLFAKNARIVLLNGVSKRMSYWGFDKSGNTSFTLEAVSGGYTFRDTVFNDPSVPKKYEALKNALKLHTVEDIIEQAAFIWFNRFIAIKILEKNNYINPVLGYVSSELDEPALLHNARLKKDNFNDNSRNNLFNRYLADNNEESAFGLLVLDFCRNHKLTNKIFGHINDYTELLLPDNLLSSDGIINLINTTDAIKDEDYKEVELIGWLYQFYIADKKDEIFKNFKDNKKARAEDIPAATQIFTPKWIVKYMTENSIGNVWLDYNPDSLLKNNLKYYVETERRAPLITDITQLTLMDPACGSGHILVEGFDLLLKMYIEEGYTAKNAVISIIKNNLFGLDIDDRASQLANFALMLKAGKYNQSLFENPIDTNILAFPEPYKFDDSEIESFLKANDTNIPSNELNKHKDLLENALLLLNQGKNLGSVIKFNLPNNTFDFIKQQYNYFEEQFNNETLSLDKKSLWIELKPFIKVLIMLNNKYLSVVANPPYMGQKNMNEELKVYVNKNYPDSKSDLFAVFMEVCIRLSSKNSYMGMINQQSWMFLSSFEKLRQHFLDNYFISSMLHLGAGTFKEISGEVVQSTAFVLGNFISNIGGTYHRLIDVDGDNKENGFINKSKEFKNIPQSNFSKIPGSPIAYWVSERVRELFANYEILGKTTSWTGSLHKTSDNERFLRNVWEVNKEDVGINKKWAYYNKGGHFKKWFGNNYLLIDWSPKSIEHYKTHKTANLLKKEYWFKEGITWTALTTKCFNARYFGQGYISDSKGASIYPEKQDLHLILALLNSNSINHLLNIIAPTLDYNVGQVINVPFIKPEDKNDYIKKITKDNLKLAMEDWDSYEISLDFRKNAFYAIELKTLLKEILIDLISIWTENFFILHKNEEELNRIFIEIYGLQDELTSDVPLKEVTILQDITYINENNELIFKKDEIIKQFLSYAIGCMMGRYSLYKEGLILANQGDSLTEYNKIVYGDTEPNTNHFMPDEDGVIPLMGSGYNFSDDITVRMRNFLEASFGADTITENINFINECLETDMDKFLTDKFWQYHYKMYHKKPIYWVFSSSGGSFKVLVYMHRMNKYTIQKIRNNYLLRHLSFLRNNIEQLSKKTRTPAEDKLLDKLRSEEIECRNYDLLIKKYADDQKEFDLDDGVTVNYALFQDILTKIK